MIFKTNLVRNKLVDCALKDNELLVDDASSYQTFKEQISGLELSEPRQAELALYCVWPRSVFISLYSLKVGSSTYKALAMNIPKKGDIVQMNNEHSLGYFIVLEVGECASLCAFVDLEEFLLTPSKGFTIWRLIKVMHDRNYIRRQMLSFIKRILRWWVNL